MNHQRKRLLTYLVIVALSGFLIIYVAYRIIYNYPSCMISRVGS
jgi:hypothetical protein